MAIAMSLDPGFLFLPLLFVMLLGFPFESKKSLFLDAFIKTSSGGIPKTSIMQASCSASFSPGKRGYPV
uniref:Putative secreted protein n=1 Tax=Panstrongylus lignarius TaxID=156445 RepID=A0A224XUU8_9HEMI